MPFAKFSDCGTYVHAWEAKRTTRQGHLRAVCSHRQIVHHFGITPVLRRSIKIPRSMLYRGDWLTWGQEIYSMVDDSGSSSIGLRKANSRDSADVAFITSYPRYFEYAEKFLILGPSQDSMMRLLFMPSYWVYGSYTGGIVIKTLRFTYAELRARLDTAQRKQTRDTSKTSREDVTGSHRSHEPEEI